VSVFVRDPATALVRTERAVEFTREGRSVRGPGSRQLERLLDR